MRRCTVSSRPACSANCASSSAIRSSQLVDEDLQDPARDGRDLFGIGQPTDQVAHVRSALGGYDPELGESYPYLILDARYERVREAGVIRSQAVLIAVAI